MTRDVHDVVVGREVVDVEVAAVELLAAELAVVAEGPFALAAVANHAVAVREPLAAVSAQVAGALRACVGTPRNPAGRTTKAFRVWHGTGRGRVGRRGDRLRGNGSAWKLRRPRRLSSMSRMLVVVTSGGEEARVVVLVEVQGCTTKQT